MSDNWKHLAIQVDNSCGIARLSPPSDPGARTVTKAGHRRRWWLCTAAGLAVAAFLVGFGIAQARDGAILAPSETIADFYHQLEQVMRATPQLSFEQRYQQLTAVLTTTFHLPRMTQLAVGSRWSSLSEHHRRQLISVFSQLVIVTYAKNFRQYNGEIFTVLTSYPTSRGRVIVATTITTAQGESVAINYLMTPLNQHWKVLDIYLNGTISELAIRRSEFSSVLRTHGVEVLLERLREDIAALIQS